MTEDEAQSWIAARFGAAAKDRLTWFTELLRDENARQNLIAQSSWLHVWRRHIVDSAQLVPLSEDRSGTWVDVGTGGGFPGLVVAILRHAPTILVEPRRRRAEFLTAAAKALALTNVQVRMKRIETAVAAPAAVLSARAVAAPNELLERSRHLLTSGTLVLLPRGRDAQDALRLLQRNWRGVFHVEQSITDPSSGIIVGRLVERR